MNTDKKNTMKDIMNSVTSTVTKEQEALIEKNLRSMVDLRTSKEKSLMKAEGELEEVDAEITKVTKMGTIEAYEYFVNRAKKGNGIGGWIVAYDNGYPIVLR